MNSSDPFHEAPRPSPPPLPGPERRAAWWAWPLILFAVLPLDWIASKWSPSEVGAGSGLAEAAATAPVDLALLKFQSQVVIATASLDPKASGVALDDLAKTVSGNDANAALALLASFIQADSALAHSLLDELDEGDSEPAKTTRKAVREGIDETGRDQLREHLGWFADLARGPDLASPPRDGPIRSRALLVLTTTGLLLTGIVVGLLCGAALLVVHLRRVHADPGANAFRAPTVHRAMFLECFSLYLGIMTAGSLLGAWFGSVYGFSSYVVAVVLPLLWPRLRGMRWKEFASAVGLHRGKGFWREIGAGVTGYFIVLAIASIGVFLTLVLSFAGGVIANGGMNAGAPTTGPEVHPVVGWIYEGGLGQRLACLFLAAGFAPFFEELFFRGALFRYFRGRFRFLPSALIGSIIFAALHPQGFYGIPALAAMGLGFSVLREWRDSLVAPMTAHAINNGCLVLMLWWVL